MPVRSLREMVSKTTIHNIHEILSVGDLDYATVGPFLEWVKDPEQLEQIQKNSPHICANTADLWKKLILRDFRSEAMAKRYRPSKPENWSQIYFRYQSEQQEELAQATEILKSSLGKLKARTDDQHVRLMTKKTIANMTFANGKRANVRQHDPTLNFTSGSRTKTSTAAGIFRKARREASEIAHVRKLNTSSADISLKASHLKQAPKSMLRDYKVASQPAYVPSANKREQPQPASSHLTIEGIEGDSSHSDSSTNNQRSPDNKLHREERGKPGRVQETGRVKDNISRVPTDARRVIKVPSKTRPSSSSSNESFEAKSPLPAVAAEPEKAKAVPAPMLKRKAINHFMPPKKKPRT